MKANALFTAAAFAAAVLAGCSSPPPAAPAPAPAAPPVQAPAPAAPPPAAAPQPVTPPPTPAAAQLPPHLDSRSPISTQRSIYFDFDDATVKTEYAQLLELHGKYLASAPALAIKVEGNADERGSAEYNIALGQRRADAVVRALRIYGVRDSQMEAVSWGEERPRAAGHDESAWSQNRRVDLTYPQR